MFYLLLRNDMNKQALYRSFPAFIPFLIFSLLSISCGSRLHLSEIENADLNKYFTLENTKRGFNNKINSVPGDKISEFIEKHKMRFDYLSFKTMMKLFPMEATELSTKDKRFQAMVSSKEFYSNFLNLTEAQVEASQKPRFSKAELMLVASRFFYCDNVKPDSSVSYHLCVGINGQHLIKTSRDLTALEAFAIEAIFYYMDREKTFIRQANNSVWEISLEERKSYADKNSYLTRVRDKCFAVMEKDEQLEKILNKHYKKNAGNIGFTINGW
jgi:hypothetical protein